MSGLAHLDGGHIGWVLRLVDLALEHDAPNPESLPIRTRVGSASGTAKSARLPDCMLQNS